MAVLVDGPRHRDHDGWLPRKLLPLVMLATFVLVLACLYWGQAVFMPLALATVLTFLLHPVVTWLERRIGRVLSIVLVVALAFVMMAGVGYVVMTQLVSLGNELPKYKDNIKQKVADLRWVGPGSSLENVQKTVEQAVGEVEKEGPAQRGLRTEPTPVVVQSDRSSQVWSLPTALGPWLQPLATAGLVVVLVVFMLLERTELRNRLLRLMGRGRLALTTRALDEAAARISRYLLMQSLVNTTFGLGVGVGLFALGVPYALVWALLAAALRFIPYVGPWLGALMPIALSLAVFDGWLKPLLVIALFFGLELFTNMILETQLYAASAGVSQVALLVAVAFWTALWGPIGLVLATPLTVCLLVLSKHVPDLEFVVILLGDAPVLEPHVSFYQRLLAGDHDEASDIAEEYVDAHPPESVYDGLLVPALVLAKRDRAHGRLSDEDEHLVLRTAREIVDDLGLRIGERGRAPEPDDVAARRPVRVLGCPARDEFDEMALVMLGQVLDPALVALEPISSALLSSEIVARVEALGEERQRQILCIATLPPGGNAHVRYLAKRLRARFPRVRIVVGRWGTREGLGQTRDTFTTAGANEVSGTVLETRDQILQLCRLRPQHVGEPVA